MYQRQIIRSQNPLTTGPLQTPRRHNFIRACSFYSRSVQCDRKIRYIESKPKLNWSDFGRKFTKFIYQKLKAEPWRLLIRWKRRKLLEREDGAETNWTVVRTQTPRTSCKGPFRGRRRTVQIQFVRWRLGRVNRGRNAITAGLLRQQPLGHCLPSYSALQVPCPATNITPGSKTFRSIRARAPFGLSTAVKRLSRAGSW